MSSSNAWIGISSGSGDIFQESTANDLLIYTTHPSGKVLIGVEGAVSCVVSQSNIVMTGDVTVQNISVTNDIIANNISVTSIQVESPSVIQDATFSNIHVELIEAQDAGFSNAYMIEGAVQTLTAETAGFSNATIAILTANAVTLSNMNAKSSSITSFFADSATCSNLIIAGDLTVNGTTTTIDTETLLIKDNMITINTGQVGIPPSTLKGGIEVDRGDLSNFLFIFEENTQYFKVGTSNELQAVATRPDALSNASVLFWNSTNTSIDYDPMVVVSAGKLGVGTNTPAEALHVQGNAIISNTAKIQTLNAETTSLSNANVIGTLNVNGITTLANTTAQVINATSYTFTGESTTGMFKPNANTLAFSTSSNESIRISSVGQVGIKVVPNYDLDVNGDIHLTGALFQNNAPFIGSRWSSNLVGDIYVMKNVGINTNDPMEALDVSGTIKGGMVKTGDGIAATPSFSFSSDTSTGIYRPASNNMGFTTAGTEKMRLTSSGFLGIGTSNPLQPLHVMGDARFGDTIPFGDIGGGVLVNKNNVLLQDGSPLTDYQLMLTANATANGTEGVGISFTQLVGATPSNATYPPGAAITFQRQGTNSTGALLFKTRQFTNNQDHCITRMIIDSTGHVGIGTSNPLQPFHVIGSSLVEGDIISDKLINPRLNLRAGGVLRSTIASATGFGNFSTSAVVGDTIIRSEANNILLQSGAGASTLCIGSNNRIGVLTVTPETALDVNGVIKTSNGTALVPSLRFSTESNTGFFRPAANSIGFTTVGTEKMRLTSGGFLGIGTSIPVQPLHVQGNVLIQSNPKLLMQTTSNAVDYSSELLFQNAGGAYTWAISRRYDAAIDLPDYARMVFSGGLSANSTQLSPILTLSPNGTVGIGTSNPVTALDVNGVIKTSDGTALVPSLRFTTESNTGFFRPAANSIGFTTVGTEKMRLTAGGFLGIGTSNPATALDVNGVIKTSDGTALAPSLRFTTESNTGFFRPAVNTIGFSTVGTEKMRLTADGFLGIGTSNPLQPLHVQGNGYISNTLGVGTSTPAAQFHIVSSSNYSRPMIVDGSGLSGNNFGNVRIVSRSNQHCGVELFDQNNANGWLMFRPASINQLRFYSSDLNQVVMAMEPSGNIGIGTIAPATALDVNGVIKTSDGTALVPSLRFTTESNTGLFRPAANTIGFTTVGTEKMRLTSGGFLGIGTIAPATALDVNGVIKTSDGTALVPSLRFTTESNTGFFRPAANTIGFTTVGTEKMRLTAGGFLGIGTSNPLQPLHVIGSSTVEGDIIIDNSNNPRLNVRAGGVLRSTIASATVGGSFSTSAVVGDTIIRSVANNILLQSGSGASTLCIGSNNRIGVLTVTPETALDVNGVIKTSNGTAALPSIRFTTEAGTGFYRPTVDEIGFTTAGAEKMRITAGGFVGIGTTAPSYELHVEGDIYATGDITGLSDARYKTDVRVIANALDKVDEIRGVTFNMITDSKRHVGVIAQEVQKVLPEAVSSTPDGVLNVAYGNMVGLLIEAVKELREEVNVLKAAAAATQK